MTNTRPIINVRVPKIIHESKVKNVHGIEFLRIVNDKDVKFKIKIHKSYYDDQSYISVDMYYFASGWKEIFHSPLAGFHTCRMAMNMHESSEAFDLDCDRVVSICREILA